MTVRTARLLIVLFVLGIAALGCAVNQVETVDGLVIDVVSASPAVVEQFTLRTSVGTTLVFTFDGPIDFGTGGFPGNHLREHQALAAPVRVTYRVAGSGSEQRLIVVRLEDAPEGLDNRSRLAYISPHDISSIVART